MISSESKNYEVLWIGIWDLKVGISFENSTSFLLKTALGMGAVSFCDTLHFWQSNLKPLCKRFSGQPGPEGNAQIHLIMLSVIYF